MKKPYSDPRLELMLIDCSYVVRTSGGVLTPENPNDDEDWENAPIP